MIRYQYSGITDQKKASWRNWVDARALMAQKRWRGAMYLAGYVLECGFKAKLMEIHRVRSLEDLEQKLAEWPGKDVRATEHNLELLLRWTGAQSRLASGDSSSLRAFQLCQKWQVSWRYAPDEGKERDCIEFLDAVETMRRFISHNI